MKKDWAKLCINHSDTFDKWFDHNKFDWDYCEHLEAYCYDYIEKWYPHYPYKHELDLSPVQIAQLRIKSEQPSRHKPNRHK